MFVAIEFLLFASIPLLFAHLLVRYFRLRNVPGPFLASFTDLWRWRAQQTTQFWGHGLVKLHERYGKIVRIGPNQVSVSDPAAVSQVYGTNPVWVKGPSYDVVVGISQGKLVRSIMTMNEAQQSAVMKGVGHAFTPNAVLEYEHCTDESAAILVEQLKKLRSFDMGKWFQLFAVDVLNRNAFSDSPGFLEQGTDVDDILETVYQRHLYFNTWGALPGLEYVIHKNAIMRWLGSPINRLATLARSQLEKRKTEKDPQDHHDFLEKYLEGRARYPNAISENNVIGMLVSSIGAGSDTTGMTLTALFYFLMKNKVMMAKLNEEIQEAIKASSLSDPPRWVEVSKLPYLDAAIKESMRIHPVIANGLDRVVPAGGREVAGVQLPAGTIVACHPESLHQDKDLFGADADKFRPERWLEAEEERYKKMERASLGFGCGKRICPGRHVALLEMKKLVPLLLMKFDWKLDDPTIELQDKVLINSMKYTLPITVTVEEKRREL